MFTRRKNLIARQLEKHGCIELAAKIRKRKGIGRQIEPTGSLNGFRSYNPYRRVLSALVSSGLKGTGVEHTRRAVDIAFSSAGLTIRQNEREILAHMLEKGNLRKIK